MESIARIKKNIEQLDTVGTPEELFSIIHHFFYDTFFVPPHFVGYYIRPTYIKTATDVHQYMHKNIEQFLLTHDTRMCDYIKTERIVMRSGGLTNPADGTVAAAIHDFLHITDLDIFIPIYTGHKLIAYITISPGARAKPYSADERLDMILFAHYIGTILPPLMNMHKPRFSHKQYLHRQLYEKKRIYALYKEGMYQGILKADTNIGIITYKQGTFILCNKRARELLPLDITRYRHHPFTQNLIAMAATASSGSKDTHSFFDYGHKLVTTAELCQETRMIIFTLTKNTVQKPYCSTLAQKNTEYDVLYNTKLGLGINALIPSCSSEILQYKTQLIYQLSCAPALFFCMNSADADALMQVLQQVHPDTPLFIWDASKDLNHHMLYKERIQHIPARSIVCIKHLRALDLETQDYFSAYAPQAGIRFVYTSTSDLNTLVAQNLCSKKLWAQLHDHTISFAPIFNASYITRSELINAYAYHAISNPLLYTANLFTAQEKQKMLDQHTSIVTLKTAVYLHVAHKMETFGTIAAPAKNKKGACHDL